MIDFGIEGTRVLVTAGASGIGRAIAKMLLESKANVWVCDIDANAVEHFRIDFPTAMATQGDVSSEADVANLFKQIEAAWGGLDFLVNNAGIGGPTAAIEDISLSDWQSVVNVNLTGVFLCSRAAAPFLKSQGSGGIINMSSVSGRLGVPQRSPYSTTKWGVIGLTKTLASELGPFGIRVNAVLPGFVEGERFDRVITNRAKHLDISFEEMRQNYTNKVSMRTFISAKDIANQVAYLISPMARYISGQSIGVCGNVEYL